MLAFEILILQLFFNVKSLACNPFSYPRLVIFHPQACDKRNARPEGGEHARIVIMKTLPRDMTAAM